MTAGAEADFVREAVADPDRQLGDAGGAGPLREEAGVGEMLPV